MIRYFLHKTSQFTYTIEWWDKDWFKLSVFYPGQLLVVAPVVYDSLHKALVAGAYLCEASTSEVIQYGSNHVTAVLLESRLNLTQSATAEVTRKS